MVNVARYGGTSLLMDFNMPVIASPQLLEKMKPNALNPDNYKPLDENSGIFKLMQGSLTADWNLDWSNIKVPTLIMTGHYDKVFRNPDDIDELAGLIKMSERLELADCGHLIPIEKPVYLQIILMILLKNYGSFFIVIVISFGRRLCLEISDFPKLFSQISFNPR